VDGNKPVFAQDMRGLGLANDDMPEWKRATFGGNKASYGKKTNLTILEQRQGLPIYKLREELLKVNIMAKQCAVNEKKGGPNPFFRFKFILWDSKSPRKLLTSTWLLLSTE